MLLACYSFGQITFTNATDSLEFSALRSGAPMAIADMNGDGLDDIVRLDSRRFLYIEYQQADTTTFEGAYFGDLGEVFWSICIADVDGNGYNDILTGGAYTGLHLLKANADGTAYSTTVIDQPPIFLQGSNFVDINTDGEADLFACHDDGLSVPFKNDGDGNFTPDFSLITATTTVPSDNSGNYGSVWTDYDNDNDLDLYIAKCRVGVEDPTDGRRINTLYQNDGNNNFTEVAIQANLIPFGQSWASDFGDFDNDGDLDVFIINHDINNSLYRNDGDGTFTDITLFSGINDELSQAGAGLQIKFADFDNDGWLDLLFTSINGQHELLHNNGNGTFSKMVAAFPVDDRIHSAVVGDLDNDGFLDIYAGYGFGYNQLSNQPDRLFLNDGNDNHYFKVLLEGTTSNTNAIGARLELYGTWGKQIREVRSGESYGIMNSLTKHFGLGAADQIDSLYIRWPSGNLDRVIAPPTDTVLMITEGDFCLPEAGFSVLGNGLDLTLIGEGDVGVTDWQWTIDGVTTLTGDTVNYLFPAPGLYNICVNTSGSCGDAQYCQTINVSCPPLQSFFVHQSDGLRLSFEDVSLGEPTDWLWEFGDGTTSTEPNPEHDFPSEGLYYVCLTIQNACGNAAFCEFIPVSCSNVTTVFDKDIDDLVVIFTDFSSAGTNHWQWDFGDGAVDSVQNPVHTYAQPGTYNVCLDIGGECGMGSYCEEITVSCFTPVAGFMAAADELSVGFSDQSENTPVFWVWDFGDGGVDSVQQPVHTYALPGTYEVCLTVGNPCGMDTICQSVMVSCAAPTAGYSVLADGLAYQFVDTTQPPANDWLWVLDGQDTLSIAAAFSYTFEQPGNYELCLQASNICGTDTLCQVLEVSCAPPVAGFDTATVGLDATFTDTSAAGPSQWQWLINDLPIDTTAVLDYTFSMPGSYEVCLIASNICGQDTTCQSITVSCSAPVAGFEAQLDELSAIFTDTSTNAPTSWAWTVDGVSVGSSTTLTYQFPAVGNYEVCLTTNSICGTDTECILYSITCQAPSAGFDSALANLTATFTDTSTAAQQWQWLVEDQLVDTTANLTYTFPSTGNYTVCQVATNGCASDTSCLSLNISCAFPVADFAVVADDLTITLFDMSTNDPDAWTWTVDGGTIGNDATLMYEFAADGQYEICLEASNGCGAGTICQVVEVFCVPPLVDFDVAVSELSVTLSSGSSGDIETSLWNFGDGNTANTTSATHTYAAPGNYMICLTITNDCGSQETNCNAVAVSCTPAEAAFTTQTDLLSATFTDITAATPEEWQWDFGDGSTSDQQNPQHLYSEAGTYTVCLTTTGLCGSHDTCQTITITCPPPVAGFNLATNGLSITATDTSQNSPTAWMWTFGDGAMSTEASPSHSYGAPGVYIVCLTSSSLCGTHQVCRQVMVTCQAPEAGFATTTDDLAVQLQDETTQSPSTWLWDFGDGTTSNQQNPQHTYAMPGTYEVCLLTSSVCGSDLICEAVSVSCAAPQADYSLIDTELSFTFLDESTGELSDYLWTFGDGTSSTAQNPQHTYATPGTYTVCLTVGSVCGTTEFCQEVVASCAAPQADFGIEVDALTVSFTDQSSLMPTEWLWTFGDGDMSNMSDPVHAYAAPGTYTVCLEAASVCGSSTVCETVTVNCAPPAAGFEATADQLSWNFNDASTNAPTEWLWDFGDGTTSNEANPEHVYAEPGFYEVCLRSGSVCGTGEAYCEVIEVTCLAPQANYSVTADELALSFTDLTADGPTSWTWTFGDGAGSTEQNPTHAYAFPGSYLVCLTTSSVCGTTQRCELQEVGCTPPQASFDFTDDELIVDFQDNSTADAVAWLWDFGDGSGSTVPSPSHAYAEPGEYEVCLTVSSICGSTTDCQVLAVSCPLPQSAFEFSHEGLLAVFSNLSAEAEVYLWDFGDGEASTQVSPTHIYDAAGTYTVCLIASSVCGLDSICQEVDIVLNNTGETTAGEVAVTVYPNPAQDYCYLAYERNHFHWELLNSQAQVVQRGQGRDGAPHKLNTANCSAGVYWVRVYTSQGLEVVKLMVE